MVEEMFEVEQGLERAQKRDHQRSDLGLSLGEIWLGKENLMRQNRTPPPPASLTAEDNGRRHKGFRHKG